MVCSMIYNTGLCKIHMCRLSSCAQLVKVSQFVFLDLEPWQCGFLIISTAVCLFIRYTVCNDFLSQLYNQFYFYGLNNAPWTN